MRRRLRLLWWWSSRATAVIGVMLAMAFVVLDVRSRWGSDEVTVQRTYMTTKPIQYHSWVVVAGTGSGRVEVVGMTSRRSRLWAYFSNVADATGQPTTPFNIAFQRKDRSYHSVLVGEGVRPESAAGRWLARGGVTASRGAMSLGKGYTDRHATLTLPLWPLAIGSALPAATLLYRRWRRPPRGFSIEPEGAHPNEVRMDLDATD